MKLKITVTLSAEDGSSERRLGELSFVEAPAGKYTSFAVPESKVQLPDGSELTISARYSPQNAGISLVVWRNAKQLALMLSPWVGSNPYLGIQIEKVGFVHLYCERLDDKRSANLAGPRETV